MKTIIHVTGQIHGNYTLAGAIGGERTSEMFGSLNLSFDSKKEAYKALWEGYKSLRSDKEDAKNSRLKYSPKRCIYYDASKATLV